MLYVAKARLGLARMAVAEAIEASGAERVKRVRLAMENAVKALKAMRRSG